MEILMSVTTGVLFMIGTYMILSRNLLRIILGTSLLTHGVHLLLLTMSRLKTGVAPIWSEDIGAYVDPLPQALILTSIVINFGVTAFFFVLAYRAYQENKTDDMEQLRGGDDE
ncbi:Na(+)/H(+) antiporter subunit C [Paenibacillus daejeonensis]|uniref:Na(+)/H(+) antiporter subunit C n=1 Tax=Paenibacillus daejeonensis TaxID=135193 RepID=UPI0003774E24|nr:Na(+)/H(+) antiporter subunit C [Paenibacillus daejeonensis]